MNVPLTATETKIRVMATDDSALYRKLLSEVLRTIPGVEVVGVAYDGEDCLEQIGRLKPDLVTLDMQMPRRDGLSTLEEIRKRNFDCEVIMVCSETRESADLTLKAFRMGALDMILKPTDNDREANAKSLEQQIQKHVQTVRARMRRRALSSRPTNLAPSEPAATPAKEVCILPRRPRSTGKSNIQCVCVGVSTGGPQALTTIINALPSNIPVPIFIVQHMPPIFTKSLAEHLDRTSSISVCEATHGEIAVEGKVYIAPGGKQMKIEKEPTGLRVIITDDPPIGSCKPSVDYLFNSIESQIGGNAIGIILTGMGNDGLEGCRRLAKHGTHIIAQSAETCVVYGMPRQVVENNLATEILPLNDIASRLSQLLPALSKV